MLFVLLRWFLVFWFGFIEEELGILDGVVVSEFVSCWLVLEYNVLIFIDVILDYGICWGILLRK